MEDIETRLPTIPCPPPAPEVHKQLPSNSRVLEYWSGNDEDGWVLEAVTDNPDIDKMYLKVKWDVIVYRDVFVSRPKEM